MSLVALDGTPLAVVGCPLRRFVPNCSSLTGNAISLANDSVVMVGYVFTEDGGSHTIDTTGSSSLGWRCGPSLTFANAGTTVKVGLAAVDTANGPPVRAVNSTNVITFDVAAVFTGGGGGITQSAWQTSVPTTGSNAAVNFKWQSHVTPTDLTGLYYMGGQGNGVARGFNQVGYFEPVAGEALDLNLSSAVAVGGSLVYVEV